MSSGETSLLMRIGEAAQLLGVMPKTLRQWCSLPFPEGPPRRKTAAGTLYFPRDLFLRWAEGKSSRDEERRA